jgi:predicted nucleic acid-binding protein
VRLVIDTNVLISALLAMASAGGAAFLLTGDKRDLLGLDRFEGTRIMTVRDFLVLHRRLP